ncbi:MAG TPA: type II secretion system F family protein [Cerasibacillus sp.]|uniref:type II secretion system F family protein n=1 Tax=Cerasibacillus sp. TaxID=2498711 RepID=UPI002F427F95
MGLLKKKIFKNNPLPKETQLKFLNRLSRALKNGYPLLTALEAFKWDPDLLKPISQITTSLQNGYSFDKALEKAAFHPAITSYLYFARDADLIENIQRSADLFARQVEYASKLRQLSRYPIILFSIFSILLFFIKQSVLPSFMELFHANPHTTKTIQISLFVVQLMFQIGITLIIIAILVAIIWYIAKHKLPIEKQIKLYATIPVFRHFLTIRTSYLFATHFSTLLKTGLSLKEILNMMKGQRSMPIICYYAELMIAQLEKGIYITNLLQNLPLLDPQLGNMFQKHADMTALETDLTFYAEFKAEEFHERMMKLVVSIQPIFFICLACFIIFIYLALMWPMFELIKTV